jgi:asparagine synthase (glutamine-hydrolysing)
MPGIMGIIDKGRGESDVQPNIDLMVKSMRHEKSYASGTYQDKPLGLSVGWVCHKDSFSDCLPIWNEKKDICLIYFGEDFMDDAEVLRLRSGGHQFHAGDASYLIHLYEDMGDAFLNKLNGSFAGLLIDHQKKRVLLFNDRYGLGRIYYYENERCFTFASEAKALLQILPELRELDLDRFAELLSWGCVFGNRTIFSKVLLMPGGSKWTFYPDRPMDKDAFFNKEEWENQPRLDVKDYGDKFLQTYPRVLQRYLRGPQAVGISLTGGIDTRMIMAWAPCLPFKRPCYTFSGIYRDCADVRIGKKVASACQQRHETIRINKDFFSEFPALAKRSVTYSDGTMDVSGSAELYMNRKARDIAPVRLTGNYGDQVIRGIIGFKPLDLSSEIFEDEFTRRMNDARQVYELNDGSPLSFFCTRQVPWYHYPRQALEMSQLTVRSPFLDNDLVALAFQAPDPCRDLKTSLRFIEEGDPSLARIPTDMGVTLSSRSLLGMARRGFQTFTKRAEYAYDYGMPRWLAKMDHALSPLHLEKLFLGRHKYYHFRIWYRNELRNYVQSLVLDPRTLKRPYFRGANLEKMVQAHINGLHNHTQEIHWILTSELIQRHLVEKA